MIEPAATKSGPRELPLISTLEARALGCRAGYRSCVMPAAKMAEACRQIHACAVNHDIVGIEIDRKDFDKLLAQVTNLGAASVRLYVKTGELLGLWEVHANVRAPRGRRGFVVVLPPKVIDGSSESEGVESAADAGGAFGFSDGLDREGLLNRSHP